MEEKEKEGEKLEPAFGRGLIPAIVQDCHSGEVLMLAWMNRDAWLLTLSTGEAHYWSRSRQKIWRKGETSGNIQKIKSVRLDCDNDAVLLQVEQIGKAACHTGRRSCFYRQLSQNGYEICSPQIFDPVRTYGK